MNRLILCQSGGTCPQQLLNLIAYKALPFLEGYDRPIGFRYPTCAGRITTNGTYASLGGMFGLVIAAEVEHEKLKHRIEVKMILTPTLTALDLVPHINEDGDLCLPIWAGTTGNGTDDIDAAEREAMK